VNSACDVIVETEPPHCQSVLDSTNANPAEETYEAEVESEPALSSEHLVNSCASVISDLKAAGVAQSVVNSFVTSMEDIVQEIHEHANESVIQGVFRDQRDTETCKNVEGCFNQLENPFTALNSDYKQSTFITSKWESVEPVELVIGSRFDSRLNKNTGKYDQVVVRDKFMYFIDIKINI
jgi:glutaminase